MVQTQAFLGASLYLISSLKHQKLYLENPLTEGVFSSRLNTIRLVAAQASISIENALLYQNLEKKVEERTHELRQVLVEKEKTQQLKVSGGAICWE